MNAQLWTEDIIVFIALILAGLLYRKSLLSKVRERFDASRAARIARTFAICYAVVVVYVMVLGILHQMGMLIGVLAYALLGVGCVGILICLQVFRHLMRG